jgi:ATP-dependent Clp protease ATP-binding subunit ClpC
MQKFEKAATLRDKEKELKEQYEKEQKKWKNKNTKQVTNITEENIAEVISNWTGIPANKITEDENIRLKNLEKNLHERVIGQNEAVEAVSKAIRRGRVGLKDPKRPIGSFLFLGPTGVGKTELSKALAESLFGNENAMIRIDMSEFMEPHSVSKLIGSPPGYVGFDEGGQLTEKIRRKPYSVILFDEIEKAHPDVMNMLLQILEDGRLTDSQGRTVDFKNTVIIMTSNIGARLITDKKSLGFSKTTNIEDDSKKEYEETKKEVMEALKKELRPEFINRIDEIIVFHKLTDNEISQIIDIMLKEVTKRLEAQKIKIELEPKVKELIASKGIDKNFGARPLRRTIQSILEDKLAEEILDGNIPKNKLVKVGVEKEKIVIVR